MFLFSVIEMVTVLETWLMCGAAIPVLVKHFFRFLIFYSRHKSIIQQENKKKNTHFSFRTWKIIFKSSLCMNIIQIIYLKCPFLLVKCAFHGNFFHLSLCRPCNELKGKKKSEIQNGLKQQEKSGQYFLLLCLQNSIYYYGLIRQAPTNQTCDADMKVIKKLGPISQKETWKNDDCHPSHAADIWHHLLDE